MPSSKFVGRADERAMAGTSVAGRAGSVAGGLGSAGFRAGPAGPVPGRAGVWPINGSPSQKHDNTYNDDHRSGHQLSNSLPRYPHKKQTVAICASSGLNEIGPVALPVGAL